MPSKLLYLNLNLFIRMDYDGMDFASNFRSHREFEENRKQVEALKQVLELLEDIETDMPNEFKEMGGIELMTAKELDEDDKKDVANENRRTEWKQFRDGTHIPVRDTKPKKSNYGEGRLDRSMKEMGTVDAIRTDDLSDLFEIPPLLSLPEVKWTKGKRLKDGMDMYHAKFSTGETWDMTGAEYNRWMVIGYGLVSLLVILLLVRVCFVLRRVRLLLRNRRQQQQQQQVHKAKSCKESLHDERKRLEDRLKEIDVLMKKQVSDDGNLSKD